MFNKNGLHLEEITMKTGDRLKTEDSSTLTASARPAACARQAKTECPLSDGRMRSLVLGVAMAVIAAAPARSTIVFKPVGRPAEVFAYKGDTMSKPLSNTNALNSPTVYFIFIGSMWGKDGDPSDAAVSAIHAAKELLDSSYLSGLTQYGSDGHAVYGGYTIDTTSVR
jgi:hypothetical protein